MARRLVSHPTTLRRGVASDDGATSASISTKTGRLPSMPANTTAPVTSSRRSARNSSDGLRTSARPASTISKTPISSVAPKRFFTLRRMRKWCDRSPSKYKTASTMCSKTRGPAIAPSLARTCETVPGADSRLGKNIVWIESITITSGLSEPAIEAAMSLALVAVPSSTAASASPRRWARMRTWSADSSPEIYAAFKP